MDGGSTGTWLMARLAEPGVPPAFRPEGGADTDETTVLRRLTRERLLAQGNANSRVGKAEAPPTLAAD
jgi:hypothetical protein